MILKAVLILFIAYITVRIVQKLIKSAVNRKKIFKYTLESKRLDTMATLLNSIAKYGIYLIAVLAMLTSVFGINPEAVIVPAGIGGVVLGFGAQSLIKDVLSGFFILMENQFAVGDMVTIENMNGTVEEIELRITKIRNFNGDLYIVPNGEITKVTNHTRGNKGAIVDVPVEYREDTGKVMKYAAAVCSKMKEEFDVIVEGPDVLGFVDLKRDYAVLRIFAKTIPNKQWEIEREIRKRIKEEFNAQGIRFPIVDFTVKET
jgi:small conductance mechanosensitive channel